jgi:hypothetical protein
MADTIVNKVAESGLITIDLEDLYPKEDIQGFDLKDHLFMGLILKEKDFREALQNLDWEQYRDKLVAVHCSADAIIPLWAYMLVTSRLSGIARKIFAGSPEKMREQLFLENIRSLDISSYTEKRIVVKGCGDLQLGEAAFVEITAKLMPVVKSLMYGEPCSTVPVYKKK